MNNKALIIYSALVISTISLNCSDTYVVRERNPIYRLIDYCRDQNNTLECYETILRLIERYERFDR